MFSSSGLTIPLFYIFAICYFAILSLIQIRISTKRGWVYLKELTKLIWKGSEGIVWGIVWEDPYKDIKLWWIYFQLSWFQILNSTNSQFHKPVPHKAQKNNFEDHNRLEVQYDNNQFTIHEIWFQSVLKTSENWIKGG